MLCVTFRPGGSGFTLYAHKSGACYGRALLSVTGFCFSRLGAQQCPWATRFVPVTPAVIGAARLQSCKCLSDGAWARSAWLFQVLTALVRSFVRPSSGLVCPPYTVPGGPGVLTDSSEPCLCDVLRGSCVARLKFTPPSGPRAAAVVTFEP